MSPRSNETLALQRPRPFCSGGKQESHTGQKHPAPVDRKLKVVESLPSDEGRGEYVQPPLFPKTSPLSEAFIKLLPECPRTPKSREKAGGSGMTADQTEAIARQFTNSLNQRERDYKKFRESFDSLFTASDKLASKFRPIEQACDYLTHAMVHESEENRGFREDVDTALDELDAFKDQMKKDIACINEQLSRISGMIMQVVSANG